MKASKKQLGYLISLAKKCGATYELSDFQDQKGTIILSSADASAMIAQFRETLGHQEDPADQKRKRIISMARAIGWELSQPGRPGHRRIDLTRLNAWCTKYGKFHKPLNDHTVNELGILIAQFQQGPFAHKLKNNQDHA